MIIKIQIITIIPNKTALNVRDNSRAAKINLPVPSGSQADLLPDDNTSHQAEPGTSSNQFKLGLVMPNLNCKLSCN